MSDSTKQADPICAAYLQTEQPNKCFVPLQKLRVRLAP